MEVILLERIAKLGQVGEVVKVKPGYARNYLLPRKKALRATDDNKKLFEARRAQLEAQNLTRRSEADKIAAKMNGVSVVLVRQAGESGQLYGSVSARDIAAAIVEARFTVERSQVDLGQPIKTLGLFPVPIHLHPEVTVTVTVNVARSAEEATTQAKTGKAVLHGEQEKSEEETREEARLAAQALFEEGAGPKDEAAETASAEAPAAEAEAATDEAPKAKKAKKAKKKEE
ncbi:MAG: 50S ribosomal protein L9 [Alphaproteobacteria bacterium]|nr:50S ribosomal protein L9 [Alphaproteobacteria bacterium]